MNRIITNNKIMWLFLAFMLIATSSVPYLPRAVVKAASTGNIVTNVNTDKSRYNPGDVVTIYVDLKNNTGASINNGSVSLYFKHLENEISTSSTQTFTLAPGATTALTFTWTPPSTDYQGYMVEAWAKDSAGNIIDNMNTAVDVSSDWLKFPRYGYITKYGQQSADVSSNVIWQLKNYHINAIQYYDWQYKHHMPISGSPTNPDSSWKNLAGEDVYRQTIIDYLNAGHASNIAGMQYNLIYGATAGYGEDGSGVDYNWALLNSPGGSQWDMAMPPGWSSPALYFFDSSNPDWQNYILNREMDVFTAFPFDGWHQDSVGDFGTKYTTDGQEVSITNTFKPFINYAKSRMGSKKLLFNPVGFKGHDQVAASNADGLYAELWPWDGFVTYNDLKRAVDTSRDEGNGRSLIVPAYMNYDAAKTHTEASPGYMNTPGVLLTDAAVFASGGSRIELGDDTRMLCSEYFPNRNMIMSDDLKQKERRYYDFLTAYENILRDGQYNTANSVSLQDSNSQAIATSTTSEANKVWTFTKKDSNYEIIHLINLQGEANNSWRDTNADYPVPTALSNFTVKYYYTDPVGSVSFASPDYDNGKTYNVQFTKGSDIGGNYITFTVPTLQYWDMIYINKAGGTMPTGTIINSGFENGTSSGWTATGSSYGVDQTDAHSGNSKAYFFNTNSYTQKLEQTVTGLSNGVYTVSAWVKQNTGTPSLCRMELTNYGGSAAYTNISSGSTYQQIQGTVNVTNGQVNIAFYISAPGNTNLQIDDVELWKN
ncbi:glycoside hydrolase family 66 protein [Clostridium sp. DJ247]|uniref:glycoside hydrolase family 66 protein n=1 Tax=Clostridium sp. DJ247 TaxID=2726188 RepID=UPI00162A24BB|nr:glycoside hydrolase family 66 protein [Clostridium sp. DJ247]MBC2579500.1 carbohydrate-binding protein [Clostridium sp. DJ247]